MTNRNIIIAAVLSGAVITGAVIAVACSALETPDKIDLASTYTTVAASSEPEPESTAAPTTAPETSGQAEGAKGYVIPYGDCPLDGDRLGERVYMDILNRSTDHVYIMMPYLILDGEMETALKFAAERGVRVVVLLPGIPDKAVPYALAKTHYGSLLESGIRIYEYTPGFIHAKCFLCDDETAAVGSINLDYRSLYLHFECGVWMHRSEAVMQLRQDMERTFACSHQILKEEWKEPHFIIRIVQTILKLFAPLL